MIRAAVNADKRGWREYSRSLDSYWRKLEVAAGRVAMDLGKFMSGIDTLKANKPSKVAKARKPKRG